MKKLFTILSLFILMGVSTLSKTVDFQNIRKAKVEEDLSKEIKALYSELKLEGKLDYMVFKKGYLGYMHIPGNKKNVLTIIDFTKSSMKERLFVIDIPKKKVIFNTHVAHGRNSGGDVPTKFSNTMSSYQSSEGFFLTEHTYMGSNGYSLVLNGLEKGLNDRAKDRAIVIHGAKYAIPVKGASRLGRSLGCPALPPNLNKPVIDAIKGGSVVYAHTA